MTIYDQREEVEAKVRAVVLAWRHDVNFLTDVIMDICVDVDSDAHDWCGYSAEEL